tara:strand:+ start:5590 stop:5784 length:195 start_codon:yes stop_codon:yes gene_type:complete
MLELIANRRLNKCSMRAQKKPCSEFSSESILAVKEAFRTPASPEIFKERNLNISVNFISINFII